MLDGWHAAQELGARGFGWLACGSGAGGRWHVDLELGARGVWRAHGLGAGGPRSLDGWHAARSWGPRFWMAGTRLRSWGPADGSEARGFGAGPRSLDGWHAAQELGAVGWHAAQELGASLDGWHAARITRPSPGIGSAGLHKADFACSPVQRCGNESAGMQREETDACEMARTSVLGPNSHGLSARRCGARFGHDILPFTSTTSKGYLRCLTPHLPTVQPSKVGSAQLESVVDMMRMSQCFHLPWLPRSTQRRLYARASDALVQYSVHGRFMRRRVIALKMHFIRKI